MRTASQPLSVLSLFSEGFYFYINFGSPSWAFRILFCCSRWECPVFYIIPHFGSVLFFLFGLARLAEQLLRTCRRSYCPKVVKRIAKNRNYLLWAFCSFWGGVFLSLSLISRVFWFSYWEGGVPVEEQGTSFGVIIGKNL